MPDLCPDHHSLLQKGISYLKCIHFYGHSMLMCCLQNKQIFYDSHYLLHPLFIHAVVGVLITVAYAHMTVM